MSDSQQGHNLWKTITSEAQNTRIVFLSSLFQIYKTTRNCCNMEQDKNNTITEASRYARDEICFEY